MMKKEKKSQKKKSWALTMTPLEKILPFFNSKFQIYTEIFYSTQIQPLT